MFLTVISTLGTQNRTEHKDMGISCKQTPLETTEHQSWGHGHSCAVNGIIPEKREFQANSLML
jgi:hypothetical protein